MAQKTFDNIKLGAFVLAALVFLILLLYMIGRNTSLFQNSYALKTRMHNVEGLTVGNNVRYAGIHAGTVKRIQFVNDSLIEVTMFIDVEMKNIIRKNAVVSVGTEGLVGSKVVNIVPAGKDAAYAEEGDVLRAREGINTDEMLQTLNRTNQDIAAVASQLKITVERINNSQGLWNLVNDVTVPMHIRRSLANIENASKHTGQLVQELNTVVSDIKQGKGSAGILLRDSAFADSLQYAVNEIKEMAHDAHEFTMNINSLISKLDKDITEGDGSLNRLLKDSIMAASLSATIKNIEEGSAGFNQNMEALKHNIFFRGYFRRLEKRRSAR